MCVYKIRFCSILSWVVLALCPCRLVSEQNNNQNKRNQNHSLVFVVDCFIIWPRSHNTILALSTVYLFIFFDSVVSASHSFYCFFFCFFYFVFFNRTYDLSRMWNNQTHNIKSQYWLYCVCSLCRLFFDTLIRITSNQRRCFFFVLFVLCVCVLCVCLSIFMYCGGVKRWN